MIAIDPQSERRYVLKAERELPTEEQSVFILRTLTLREQNRVEDRSTSMSEDGRLEIRAAEARTLALELGLTGWENVRDRQGNEVPFTGTKQKSNGIERIQPDHATLERLSQKVRLELAEAINAGSRIDEEEAGNSSESDSKPLVGTD